MQLILLALISLSTFAGLVSSEVAPEIVPVDGGKSGRGTTTRYWDCCKPSCSWTGNINTPTMTPIRSCAKDGSTVLDDWAQSGCGDNGTSFMCNNQHSFVVNSTLAYGFAGASFTGGVDYNYCCACMLLTFQDRLAGKKMVVQVTNTGGDANVNQFDLATPGGGVGINTKGCHDQWNAPENGWGDRYGGVHSAEECSQLPGELQDGCRFRFEFLEGADNPQVSFYQVECPKEIVEISNCAM